MSSVGWIVIIGGLLFLGFLAIGVCVGVAEERKMEKNDRRNKK